MVFINCTTCLEVARGILSCRMEHHLAASGMIVEEWRHIVDLMSEGAAGVQDRSWKESEAAELLGLKQH